MTKPTCFDCIHSIIDPGSPQTRWEPEEPAYLESCKNMNVHEEIFEHGTEDDFPERCNGFEPIMVDKCGHCNKPINQPQYLWKIWDCHWYGDTFPVCSEDCKNAHKVMLRLSDEDDEEGIF